jgi:hypothetical protein
MKINIVNLDKEGWILTKFAKKIFNGLKKKNHEVYLSKKPRNDVDVNHYIIFLFLKNNYNFYPDNTINTTMLTHVNDQIRYDKIKSTSKFLDAGIAMSKHHAREIELKKLGLKKVFYVLPPHDNDQMFKKINFGIFSNLYTDGRKNERNFEKAFLKLDPDLFKLTIIGKGWNNIVKKLRENKIEVNHWNFFFRYIYIKEFRKIDYLIYLGNDEGSMTFMDAIQLGVKTIMVPQGFQHDLKDLITFKVDKNLRNLDKILLEILDSKIIFKKYKDILTWDNYVEKHLDIWKKIQKSKN